MLKDSLNLVYFPARFVLIAMLKMKLPNIFFGIVLIGFMFVGNTPN